MSSTATYGVLGMTCGHCVQAVSSELRELPGVRDVEVELVEGGTSVVRVVSDEPLTEETVRAAVDEAGLRAGGRAVTSRPDSTGRSQVVDLQIGGMTCASCAARIEKKLNRMAGVTATVNYATEKAHVTYADGVTPDDLVATVERTGYTAELPGSRRRRRGGRDGRRSADRRRRARCAGGCVVSALLTVPVRPAGDGARRCSSTTGSGCRSTLAAPVVTWGAWPFHRAALDRPAARRDDDGHPGVARRRRGLRLVAVRAVPRRRRRDRHGDAVHAGAVPRRPAPTRSTSRSPPASPCSCSSAATSRPGPGARPAPRCARCCRWAPRTSPSCATAREVRVAGHRPAVGDEFVVRPGEKVATDGEVVARHLGRRRVDAHRRAGAGRGRSR